MGINNYKNWIKVGVLTLLAIVLFAGLFQPIFFPIVLLTHVLIAIIVGWSFGLWAGLLTGIVLSVARTIFVPNPLTNFTNLAASQLFLRLTLVVPPIIGGSAGWASARLREVRQLSNELIHERQHLQQEIDRRYEAEQQLQHALLVAQEASRAKSAFLANMSHELRTPLAATIGYNELLLELVGDNVQLQTYLQKALSSANHLHTVINDILDLSRIEAGHLNIRKTSFYLKSCITSVLDMMVVKTDEKGLHLRYEIKSNTPAQLKGDEMHLQQVLINLLGNAIKFTEEGNITLSISAEYFEDTKYFFHFVIEDSGIGIPPAEQKIIFDTFRQVDNSLTRAKGGTGLGLAISKRLIEAMGGTIHVESEVGTGSIFYFYVEAVATATPTWQTDGIITHRLSHSLKFDN